MHHGQNKILQIKNLHVEFPLKEGTVRALQGVDLTFFSRETLGLVGESGCGKSMTARAMLGLVPEPGEVTQGEILLARKDQDPIDITKLHPDGEVIRNIRGADIAMIFQEPMTSLSPVHTIGNQIMEAIILHQKTSKERAAELAVEMLQAVGLPDASRQLSTYPFELSGGMRQRVMVAMALSCDPKLLIADEATTALDVTIQAQILNLLKDIQEERDMSIMVVTHNLGVVAAVTHRVAVMYLGRIVEEAPVEMIFEQPKHPYTQGLLASVPKVGSKVGGRQAGRLQTISGDVPDPLLQVSGCTFHLRCPRFMRGICDREVPPFIETSEDQQVRCYLYSEDVPEAEKAQTAGGEGPRG